MEKIAITAVISYLLGSIPNAYLIPKLFYKTNIMEHGSKNAGATNVFRTLGTFPFALTLALDVAKGMAAVLITAKLYNDFPYLLIVTAISALLGHTFSFWIKFKGGKGVATGLGVFIAISPKSTLTAMAVFYAVLFATRMVSASSIAAALCLPVAVYFYQEQSILSTHFAVFSALAAAFVIYKHKENIKRIRAGTESKLPMFTQASTRKEENEE
ncbi:MAG: glycerol-3-phosphate 1-O-acyltransferase PlsY [Candidatus Riflebacteria bacterium]|nr:glycerol-3-phosphate 1-O-acyltransferase PlsY [Candidatus Riflebacteria bacterium]